MSAMTLDQAIKQVYQSLNNDNEDIDLHIRALRDAMTQAGKKEAVFEPSRLAQGNRAGRKMMQSYFKKRGVAVTFGDS